MRLVGLSFGQSGPSDEDGAMTIGPRRRLPAGQGQARSDRPRREFASAPLCRGYLPFDDLTGVVGPNDSGKTQLLELIAGVLAGTKQGVLFAECSPEEFSALTAHALADLVREVEEEEEFDADASTEYKSTPGDRSTWWDGPSWSDTPIDATELESIKLEGGEDAVPAWHDALLHAVQGQEHAWQIVLRAAAGHHAPGSSAEQPGHEDMLLVALEPAGIPKPQRYFDPGMRAILDAFQGSEAEERSRPAAEVVQGWSLYWCLPPFDTLPQVVSTALVDLGIRPSPSEPADLWEERMAADPPSALEHCRLRHAPILVAPVGRTPLAISPLALQLPLDLASVIERISTGLRRFVSVTRWAERLLEESEEFSPERWGFDDLGEGNSESWQPVRTDEALSIYDNRSGIWQLHPHASHALSLIAGLARALLPGFISDRYELRDYLVAAGSDDWKDPEVSLRLAGVGDEDDEFSIDQAAEGYKVWIQLALLTAVDLVERLTARLRGFADAVESAGDDMLLAEDEDWDREEVASGLSRSREALSEALEEFRSGRSSLGADLLRMQDLRVVPPSRISDLTLTLVDLLRPRLYLIDEPERHLHPRLQREAAEWLTRVARRQRSQVVLATHSIPFMGITAGASYTYLTRAGVGPALLTPISPRSLDRLDAAADDLGLNRGELLALIKVFLWVEGPMDKAVIEALFAKELRENGIAIAPLSGHGRASALLDAPLLDVTEAKVAVWLDNIPAEYLERLRRDPGYARDAAVKEKDERKTLAKLVVQACEQEKEIHPVGGASHAPDVFDLLDDEAIEELFPDYPGHEAAQAKWADAMDQGRRKGERKAFWAQEFKTPINEETCRRIAERMRERGRSSPELTAVVENCERLALEVR